MALCILRLHPDLQIALGILAFCDRTPVQYPQVMQCGLIFTGIQHFGALHTLVGDSLAR
jgi:hypothetical protein